MSSLDEASRAILGLGVDTSGALQTGPMFQPGTVTPRSDVNTALQPAMAPPTDSEPALGPAYAAPDSGSPAPQTQAAMSPALKWGLVAAVVVGVGAGVYYATRSGGEEEE